MIPRALADIESADIQALLDDQVRESRTLDYKQVLPTEKVPFLKDVSALANTDGGDIVFGVREKKEDGKQTGIPEEVVGLRGFVFDPEVRRLDDIIRNGLKPRLTEVRYKQVDCPSGPVLVMRVERGFAGPHMVAHDEKRFWGRADMSNYELDVDELRRLFLRTAELPERIRRFRTERIERIIAGETPLPLPNVPKVVLHIIPVRSFDPSTRVDVRQVGDQMSKMPPLDTSGWDGRYNLDGFLTYRSTSQTLARTYTQLFRNGVVEAVEAGMLHTTTHPDKVIPADYLVKTILQSSKVYLGLLGELNCHPPYVLTLSLIAVNGFYITGQFGLASI